MSFSLSKGPNVGSTGDVGDTRMVVGYAADSPFSTMLVGIVAVHFNVSGTIAEDTLCDLGTSFGWVSHSCAPFAVGVFVFWTILPSISEVCDACIEHGAGDIGGYGGVVEDTWLELSISIGASQRSEGVVFFPSHIPVELFEFCQIFRKVGHLLICVAESLDLPS